MRNFQGIILYEFEYIERFSNLHSGTFNFDFWKAFIVQGKKNFDKFAIRVIDILENFNIVPSDIALFLLKFIETIYLKTVI